MAAPRATLALSATSTPVPPPPEIKTPPLTSIRALSEMLFDDPDIALEDRSRFLGIIVKETERLTRLVNQVLDLAKIESGHAQWHDTEVDLIELVHHAADTGEQLLRDRGAQLDLVIPDHMPILHADRDRLVQVVVNLIGNAARFVPPGKGRVEVRLGYDEHDFRVDVSDNGPGIEPAMQSEIFERFRQVGGGSEKPTGTGLGLPISRQIIEHFGGRLWVESTPGAGATFSFTLPRSLGE